MKNMRQINCLYVLLLCLLLFSCNSSKKSNDKEDKKENTKIEIIKKQHDFGIVNIGEQVEEFFYNKKHRRYFLDI